MKVVYLSSWKYLEGKSMTEKGGEFVQIQSLQRGKRESAKYSGSGEKLKSGFPDDQVGV